MSTIIITRELLDAGLPEKGSWGNEQIKSLGLKTVRGWMKSIIGKEISLANYERFIALTGNHQKKKKVKDTANSVVKTPVKNTQKNRKKKRVNEYKDVRWLALRKIVLERDGYTCSICKNRNVVLHVHHWRYQGFYIWDTNPIFLTTLCKNCHKRVHSFISRNDM